MTAFMTLILSSTVNMVYFAALLIICFYGTERVVTAIKHNDEAEILLNLMCSQQQENEDCCDYDFPHVGQ